MARIAEITSVLKDKQDLDIKVTNKALLEVFLRRRDFSRFLCYISTICTVDVCY